MMLTGAGISSSDLPVTVLIILIPFFSHSDVCLSTPFQFMDSRVRLTFGNLDGAKNAHSMTAVFSV
jgi:hypothetical protein